MIGAGAEAASPPQVLYSVRIVFPGAALASEYEAWLVGEHVRAVLAAGALGATVVRYPGPPPALEVHYRFPSPAAFAAYERGEAPRLRAAGLARFPLDRGHAFERRLGEVVRSGG